MLHELGQVENGLSYLGDGLVGESLCQVGHQVLLVNRSGGREEEEGEEGGREEEGGRGGRGKKPIMKISLLAQHHS